jgi:hypothetical protein
MSGQDEIQIDNPAWLDGIQQTLDELETDKTLLEESIKAHVMSLDYYKQVCLTQPTALSVSLFYMTAAATNATIQKYRELPPPVTIQ